MHGNEEQISKVRETIKGKNGEPISFESFLPTPKENNLGKKVRGKGGGSHKRLSLHNALFWRRENWGTCSEAEFVDEEVPNGLMFYTISDTPYAAMWTLSTMFPEITFHIIFSSEYAGEYSGEYTFKAGDFLDERFYDCFMEENSTITEDEAMEYHFLTHEYARKEWKKDEDGEWVKTDYEEDWSEIDDEEEEEEEEEGESEYYYAHMD